MSYGGLQRRKKHPFPPNTRPHAHKTHMLVRDVLRQIRDNDLHGPRPVPTTRRTVRPPLVPPLRDALTIAFAFALRRRLRPARRRRRATPRTARSRPTGPRGRRRRGRPRARQGGAAATAARRGAASAPAAAAAAAAPAAAGTVGGSRPAGGKKKTVGGVAATLLGVGGCDGSSLTENGNGQRRGMSCLSKRLQKACEEGQIAVPRIPSQPLPAVRLHGIDSAIRQVAIVLHESGDQLWMGMCDLFRSGKTLALALAAWQSQMNAHLRTSHTPSRRVWSNNFLALSIHRDHLIPSSASSKIMTSSPPIHRRASSFDAYDALMVAVNARVAADLGRTRKPAGEDDADDDDGSRDDDDLGWDETSPTCPSSPLHPFRTDLTPPNESIPVPAPHVAFHPQPYSAQPKHLLDAEFAQALSRSTMLVDMQERYIQRRLAGVDDESDEAPAKDALGILQEMVHERVAAIAGEEQETGREEEEGEGEEIAMAAEVQVGAVEEVETVLSERSRAFAAFIPTLTPVLFAVSSALLRCMACNHAARARSLNPALHPLQGSI
ncbi:hypothetical protein BDK51DRAFT_41372 [Blyttiomyces helicus]|uniref:Uncharacterized protein n=1 Tax=Blyttiomyces helicus TaxID=388810 RepID=A0A4P9WEI2_9FUNG|nr:hypothetical protein BDK51DRAFT_41372 [Blyttiomyces helicus]|eukprot:RKO89678.1 hypothetical protein BDK51DRAFT_41372 [Blyttiomyces helicus]